MSGIQLSAEMVSDIKAAIVKHDAAADNDMLYMQYLAAVAGFVLAHQDNESIDKREFIADLSGFMGQVVDQVERDLQPQQPQEDAFGIWKPGQS